MTSAAQIAADIAVLLHRGRVAPALAQLERLPTMTADEVDAAYQQGRLDLTREIKGDAKPPRPKKPTNASWLRERIIGPALRERAKATLRLDDRLLDAIAEGGVGLGQSSWRKLREALGR